MAGTGPRYSPPPYPFAQTQPRPTVSIPARVDAMTTTDAFGVLGRGYPQGAAGNIFLINNVTTSNTVGVATGYGVALTPVRSGAFLCTGAMIVSCDTSGGGANWWMFYTLGGILAAGTQVNEDVNGSKTICGSFNTAGFGATLPMTSTGIVFGLPIGTTVYFQIGISAATVGSVTLTLPPADNTLGMIATIIEL